MMHSRDRVVGRVLRRLPDAWKRAINRASLPVQGVPESTVRVEATQEQLDDPEFNFNRDVVDEARWLMFLQDDRTFGMPMLWTPWSNLCERVGVEIIPDYAEGKPRRVIVFYFRRPAIAAFTVMGENVPVKRRHHLAAWVTHRYGMLVT